MKTLIIFLLLLIPTISIHAEEVSRINKNEQIVEKIVYSGSNVWGTYEVSAIGDNVSKKIRQIKSVFQDYYGNKYIAISNPGEFGSSEIILPSGTISMTTTESGNMNIRIKPFDGKIWIAKANTKKNVFYRNGKEISSSEVITAYKLLSTPDTIDFMTSFREFMLLEGLLTVDMNSPTGLAINPSSCIANSSKNITFDRAPGTPFAKAPFSSLSCLMAIGALDGSVIAAVLTCIACIAPTPDSAITCIACIAAGAAGLFSSLAIISECSRFLRFIDRY